MHRYVYVKNNPINHTDPSGLCPPILGDLCKIGRQVKQEYDSVQRTVNNFNYRATNFINKVERVGNDVNRALHRAEQSVKTFVKDPVGTTKSIIRKGGADFREAMSEAQTTWRESRKQAERGDWEGAAATFIVGGLDATGVTDSQLGLTLARGFFTSGSENIDRFNHAYDTLTSPYASSTARWQAVGTMTRVGFNVATLGVVDQTIEGIEQGDPLAVVSGVAQILAPGLKGTRLFGAVTALGTTADMGSDDPLQRQLGE